jgi:hypothetical protein
MKEAQNVCSRGITNSFYLMMTRFALNSVGLFHLCAAACLLLATLPTSVEALTPPAITSQPANQTVDVGQSATLSVTAGGTDPLSYQWLKDGKILTGATNSAYTIPTTGSQGVAKMPCWHS